MVTTGVEVWGVGFRVRGLGFGKILGEGFGV